MLESRRAAAVEIINVLGFEITIPYVFFPNSKHSKKLSYSSIFSSESIQLQEAKTGRL
jgi:hypothetical protein